MRVDRDVFVVAILQYVSCTHRIRHAKKKRLKRIQHQQYATLLPVYIDVYSVHSLRKTLLCIRGGRLLVQTEPFSIQRVCCLFFKTTIK